MPEAPTQQKQSKPAEPAVEQPKLWHVILLNDDHHTYEYVVLMMQSLFGHPIEKGVQIAKKVDTEGRAICMTTHMELAELKQEQVHGFGRDPLMDSSEGSMSCVIEPADYGEDDGVTPPGNA